VSPVIGLTLAPLCAAAAALVFPHLALSEAAASALHFGSSAGAALLSLTLAARSGLSPRNAGALLGAGLASLALGALAGARPALAAVMVDFGLVSIAHAVGGSIGRRVSHPGHLLPACAVAAAADVASVVHPAGPSHAIAQSERALSLLAIGFPVPGTAQVAPALGLGDLVFLALVLGVGAAHGFSLVRTAISAALGLAAAGALSALSGREVPALVPLGAALLAGLPEARRLRPEDRRTAAIAVTVAMAVVAGVLLSPR
jgi:hypothetical protein